MKSGMQKIFIWTASLLVGLPPVLSLSLILINWHDRAPSPAAIALMKQYKANSTVVTTDNGYVITMGFATSPANDPYEIGQKRIQWITKVNEVGASLAGPDPLDVYDFRSKRDAKAQAISLACNRDSHAYVISQECVKASGDIQALQSWISSESWLLARYQRLLSQSTWTDEAPSETATPVPQFSLLIEGQKLLLEEAIVLAKEKRVTEVQHLLASDARFWRRILSSTNLILTKMIATAALERHFLMGNLAVRILPANVQQDAIPFEWKQAVSNSERSMHNVMAGEWMLTSAILKTAITKNKDEGNDVWDEDGHAIRNWTIRLANVFYKLQDTKNRAAERNIKMADAADVGYAELDSSLQKLEVELKARFSGPSLSWVYNPIGKSLLQISNPAYSDYPRRVADIEGVRRATLAAFELHINNVGPSDIVESLKKSPYRNPYTNDPFDWDAAENAIVFRGLAKGERGVHHVYY